MKKGLFLKHCELFDKLFYITHRFIIYFIFIFAPFNVAVEKEDKKRKVFFFFTN